MGELTGREMILFLVLGWYRTEWAENCLTACVAVVCNDVAGG